MVTCVISRHKTVANLKNSHASHKQADYLKMWYVQRISSGALLNGLNKAFTGLRTWREKDKSETK